MQACYVFDVWFVDLVFLSFNYEEICVMWAMFVFVGKDLELSFLDVYLQGDYVFVNWQVIYIFFVIG